MSTPNDKLECFVNCYKSIVEGLTLTYNKKGGIGADESLPLCIYVLLKATQSKLYSNIKFFSF